MTTSKCSFPISVPSKLLFLLIFLASILSVLPLNSEAEIEFTRRNYLRSASKNNSVNNSVHIDQDPKIRFPHLDQQQQHRTLANNLYTDASQSSDDPFVIFIGVILGILTIGQLALFVSIIIHRNRTEIKVLQPFLLASFVLLGSISTISCYFLFFPRSDWVCQLRDPFLMITLNLIACVLISRIWRINFLTMKLNQLGQNLRKKEKGSKVHEFLESIIMKTLSLSKMKTRKSLRQCVKLLDALKLIFFLMIPQIIVQTLNVAIPSLRATATIDFNEDNPFCARSTMGNWLGYLGMLLVVFKFSVVLILATGTAKNHPESLNETSAFQESLKVFILILILIIPSYAVSDSTKHRAYLLSCIFICSHLPLQYMIAVPKVIHCWSKKPEAKLKLHRQSITSYAESSTVLTDQDRDKTDIALETAQVYEEMGLPDKSIDAIDECLKMWRFDRKHKKHVLHGGFTQRELNFLTAHDLECILKLSVMKCKAMESLDPSKNDYVNIWLGVLDMYENAPESANIEDKSVVFTIYSGIIIHLNEGGKNKDDILEEGLVKKFVNETEDYEDPIHKARALALQANYFAKVKEYQEAVEVVEKIKSFYVFEEHHQKICASYGSDRVAHVISMSALWKHTLGFEDEAMKTCDYVVKKLLPNMDKQNAFNTGELLWPIMGLLKLGGNKNAREMLNLFYGNVIGPFYKAFGEDGKSVLKPLFRPLATLLRLIVKEETGTPDVSAELFVDDANNVEENKDDNSDEIKTMLAIDVDKEANWFAEGTNGEFNAFYDAICTERGWTTNMVSCEACILLSRNLDESNLHLRQKLISKAEHLGKLGVGHSKDLVTGNVKFPVPNGINEPILKELEKIKNTEL